MAEIEFVVDADVDSGRILDAWFSVETWSSWNKGVEWMEVDGSLQAGATARMKIPEMDDPLLMTFVWVDAALGFEDETAVPGTDLVVYVAHQVVPTEHGSTRISYSARCEGQGAQEALDEITADFPQVIDSLIDWVKRQVQ